MISAIIAEDDIEMLEGLASLICWDDYGFCIVGKARNGFEALKLVTAQTPDVIITDITMPAMGGLELLCEAKKLNPEIHCVIISCHEDFEYAREAIRLEADEYLIKHTLTEEGLLRAVLSLKDKIEKKKRLQEELSLAIRGLNINRYAIIYRFFNDLMEGNILSDAQTAEQARITDIPLPPDKYRIVALYADDTDDLRRVSAKYGSFEYCVSNIIENSLCDTAKFVLFPSRRDSFILLFWEEDTLDIISGSLVERLEKVQRNIKSILGVLLSICVGGVYNSVAGLTAGITDVYKLRSAYFYIGTGAFITESRVYPLCELNAVYREFAPKMKQKNTEKLMEICHDLFARPYDQYEPSAVKALLSRLLIEIACAFDYVGNTELPQINGATLDACAKMFEDGVRHISASAVGTSSSHCSIAKSLEYIDAHLGEDISCEGVAAHINMNASYFSRLFKREMATNFSDYLLYKRIQAATGLLLHSTMSVDEIASSVGIESVSYFYRAYKRLTGNTPGDVRNRLRGGE